MVAPLLFRTFASSSSEAGDQSHSRDRAPPTNIRSTFCTMETDDSKFEGTGPIMFGVQIAKLSLRVVKLLNGTESRVLRYRTTSSAFGH